MKEEIEMTVQPDPKVQSTLKRERVRRVKIRRRRTLLVAFVLLFSSLFVINSEPFKVKIIEVSGVKRTSAEEVYKRSEIVIGESLVTLPVAEIRGRIKDKQPLVKEAEVRRELPSRVHIQVYEREPFAYVSDSLGENVYLIDAERFVLEKPKGIADPKMFHVVSDGVQHAEVGEVLEFPFHDSFARICDSLERALSGKYSKLVFNFGGIKLFLNDGSYVMLGDKPDDDIEKKILLIPVIAKELNERKLKFAGLNLSELAVPTYVKAE